MKSQLLIIYLLGTLPGFLMHKYVYKKWCGLEQGYKHTLSFLDYGMLLIFSIFSWFNFIVCLFAFAILTTPIEKK